MPNARLLTTLLAFVACCAPVSYAREPDTAPSTTESTPGESAGGQIWSGVVTLPTGQELEFAVYLTPEDDGSWGGSIDIPVQGVDGAPLRDVKVDGGSLAFTLAIPGTPEASWPRWTLDVTGDKAEGLLHQSGMEFPTAMERTSEAAMAEAAEARRPQTPKPPFPYRAETVTVDAGDHTLAGTLTLPAVADFGDGPYPAVVLITGSGPQDRDETLFDHKPFAVIADHLTRQGVAVLRCDDRGVGASTGDFSTATTLDFAEDVRAEMAFLAGRDDIDTKRIGLVGHSEGGEIAPIVTADNDKVAFVVLLAGCGVPGDEVLVGQAAVILRRSGVPEARIERSTEARKRLVEKAKGGASPAELYDDARTLVEIDAGAPMSDEAVDAAANMVARQMASPWMVGFINLDPRAYLTRVKCPVLALNGELDLQVLPDENLGAIEDSLEKAGNTDVSIVRLDGLNHLFQQAKTGLPAEYSTITQTFDPDALDTMSGWILEHTAE